MGDDGVERSEGVSAEDRARAWRAYRMLNDSVMQQRLRARRQWFCGAVYGQPGDYDLGTVRHELRRMRELGFNVVRFQNCDPVEIEPGRIDFRRPDEWLNVAAEVGMQVLVHFPFGQPGSDVLSHHGLTLEEFHELGFAEPLVVRIVEGFLKPVVERYRAHPALLGWVVGDAEAGAGDREATTTAPLRDFQKKRFAVWLRQRYRTLEEVDRTWSICPAQGKPILGSFDDAWRLVKAAEAGAGRYGGGMGPPGRGGEGGLTPDGPTRDLLRFQAEQRLTRAGIGGAHPEARSAAPGSDRLGRPAGQQPRVAAGSVRVGAFRRCPLHHVFHVPASRRGA